MRNDYHFVTAVAELADLECSNYDTKACKGASRLTIRLSFWPTTALSSVWKPFLACSGRNWCEPMESCPHARRDFSSRARRLPIRASRRQRIESGPKQRTMVIDQHPVGLRVHEGHVSRKASIHRGQNAGSSFCLARLRLRVSPWSEFIDINQSVSARLSQRGYGRLPQSFPAFLLPALNVDARHSIAYAPER